MPKVREEDGLNNLTNLLNELIGREKSKILRIARLKLTLVQKLLLKVVWKNYLDYRVFRLQVQKLSNVRSVVIKEEAH